jgi:hypothetical protein
VARRPLLKWALVAAAVLVCGALLWVRIGGPGHPRYGGVRMVLRLPGPLKGQSEPLLTTGHAGAGDFIYVTYVDGRHVIVGHDKWDFGGKRSGPITVDYQEPQTVEIRMDSLYPSTAAEGEARAGHGVSVKWNGVLVLSEASPAYPSKPEEITVGENAIGGSSTLRRFSGQILSVARGGD